MPRFDRNEAIIIEVAIPQATPIRVNIKNAVLIIAPSIAGDTEKYQLRIDVYYFAS